MRSLVGDVVEQVEESRVCGQGGKVELEDAVDAGLEEYAVIDCNHTDLRPGVGGEEMLG
jgi:hypothetical protein